MRFDDAFKRTNRNCDSESNPAFWISYDSSIKRCPKLALTDEVSYLITIYSDWRDFEVLPYEGSIFDQPAWVYEAIRVFEQVNAEADRIEHASSNR